MPKTSPYFYNFLEPSNDNIGPARKLGNMQSVSITEVPNYFSYNQFGCGVFTSYATHEPTSPSACQSIHSVPLEAVHSAKNRQIYTLNCGA